jgi:hypothetical protein
MPRELFGRLGTAVAAVVLAVLGGCDRTPTGPTPTTCQYSVTPVEFSICMPARNLSLTIDTTTGCPWSIASSASWITLNGSATGAGLGHLPFSVPDNWDAPRAGSLTVQGPVPSQTLTVPVSQAGCHYGVSQHVFGFSTSGGTGTLQVLQQSDPILCGGATQDACLWFAVSSDTWITVTSPMPRVGDNPLSFIVASNAGEARIGTITVRDQIVTIMQAGR